MIQLKPFDIVVVDGLWYMPHHWMIRQRGQGDKAVHNAIILNEFGATEDVDFTKGLYINNISHYNGRHISIHRFKSDISDNKDKMFKWFWETHDKSKGYDFGQIKAAYFGITSENYLDDETRWTCSERSYWTFANFYKITERPEILPHPRWVRYNQCFECIFDNILY